MVDYPTEPMVVAFECTGQAVGKMRNELDVRLALPRQESFTLATDEGGFHGGDGTAPPPLALFVGGLTGCIMTQMRAFSRRLGVPIRDLRVETRVEWTWTPTGRTYETAPHSFAIDVILESDAPLEKQLELIAAAKRGCFIEQTLGRANTIRHRLKTAEGFVDA
jgi:Predicted redox protein, regulator of disulfide bond formation